MIIFHAPIGDVAVNGKHVVLVVPDVEPAVPGVRTKIILNAIGDGGRSVVIIVPLSVNEVADLIRADGA